jgi:cyclase
MHLVMQTVRTAYSRLLKLKNSGVTAEDAVAAQPLADLEAAWGDGLIKGDRWISIVYPAVF